jgi:DNA-directed RNA polymerase specialized sigma24 family protein
MGQEEQDALLQRYLNERDAAVAQECLEELLSGYVEPVVRDITRYKSRANFTSSSNHEIQDEEDIRSDVVLQLISRLQGLRGSGGQPPIEDFRAYVAATTYNAHHKYLRMKYPARWRLKNRLRYLLNHHGDFANSQNESGEYLCGLAVWRKELHGRNTDVASQQGGATEFVNSLALGESVGRMSFMELVKRVLVLHGRPVLLDHLVGIIAELQNIRDLQPVQQVEYGEEGNATSVCELLPDPNVDIAATLEQRFFLEKLWKEVCQLPQRQRVALLLNLRDSRAGDALILFTVTGIASLPQIAKTLEIPIEELTSLWNKLPLQDAEIAVLLGITRQQVINLRKSARERLARRVAAT